jgi:LysR family hydrogen peroxide-inducible transcriptional activator
MNFQQLEYILAVDRYRHFVTAAEKCYVTQATLSTMIRKLEEELGVILFDRSHHPVVPTAVGKKIINQARVVLQEAARLREMVRHEKEELVGDLHVGMIPTLAPYLLPFFLAAFQQQYPGIHLILSEITTSEIIERLRRHELHCGLLALPVNENDLICDPLFYEEFVIYTSLKSLGPKKKLIPAERLKKEPLWLLEEGHCLRNQVINLCDLKGNESKNRTLDLSAASLETLRKVVDMLKGTTILPELALAGMSRSQARRIRYFQPPVPVRCIGLVRLRYSVKAKMLDALRQVIVSSLPPSMLTDKNKKIISPD